MGSKSSKPEKTAAPPFGQQIRDKVEEEIARRMMIQREVQMAVNIAKARDTIYIFGSIYLTFVSGIFIATLLKKPVPPVAGVPVVVGALVLGNMADMAYGNKLARVNKEAAYILEHERPRFVPFPQAPFARFYSPEERAVFYDPARAVGDMPPYSSLVRSFAPKDPKS